MMKFFDVDLQLEPSYFGKALPAIAGPTRIVIDSTDNDNLGTVMKHYESTKSFPTITLDPKSRRIFQHHSAGMAPQVVARDLHAPWRWGETVWVNLVKMTSDDLAPEEMEWVVETLTTLAEALGVKLNQITPTGPSDATYKTQEMTWGQWVAFEGVCSAQSVPRSGRFGPGAMTMFATPEAPVEVVEAEGVVEEGAVEEEAPAITFSGRTLSLGSKGKQVNHLRDVLIMGEGEFDERLEMTVSSVQAATGLEVTGEVDRDTWDAIMESTAMGDEEE